MVTIHNIDQRTDEWLAERVGKFTGSNAIKLLKYGRTDKARVEANPSFTGNYWTKRGQDLEPFAIAAYEMVKDVKVERPGFITNDDYPECLFSPDGIVGKTLIEVKCFGEKKHTAVNRKNIPDEILAQVHFGMIMAELEDAHLVLFSDEVDERHGLKIIPIKQDKKLIARLKNLMEVRDGTREKSNRGRILQSSAA
jgi:hypothetical protein